MSLLALVASLYTSPVEIPKDVWRCRNQIEVWCSADGCAAAADPDAFTPMDIWARTSGAVSVCAYTGCWEGDGKVVRSHGRILWTASNVQFVSGNGGPAGAELTLLINESDGVGFVRVSGFANPLLCSSAASDVNGEE